MDIMKMTKEDFEKVEYLKDRKGRLEFYSVILFPTGHEHDSGFMSMAFILLDKNEQIIGKVGGGSDVLHLDGIGGFGYHRPFEDRFFDRVTPKGWSIDMLPSGYCRVFTNRTLFIADDMILSSAEIYSEE